MSEKKATKYKMIFFIFILSYFPILLPGICANTLAGTIPCDCCGSESLFLPHEILRDNNRIPNKIIIPFLIKPPMYKNII